MVVNKELVKDIILYIGDLEQEYRPYFTIDQIKIPTYKEQDIYNHVALMIEGEIIHGLFVEHANSPHYGYLVGGLNTESKYIYNQLKQQKENEQRKPVID